MKEPVVFLHAFPLASAMWRPQLEAVGGKYRALAYDTRGFGKSDPGDGVYLLEAFVDDLIAFLDGEKIEKAVLCGLSMGGYVALRAAERNPERVAALVLADTRSDADGNEAKLKRAKGADAIARLGLDAYAGTFLKSVLAPRTLAENPALVESLRKIIVANPPLGVRAALIAMAGRTDTTASLAAIRVPTLILVGEEDLPTPPALARGLHEAIAGSRLEIIPGAGHFSNLENPEAFNRALLAFLDSLR